MQHDKPFSEIIQSSLQFFVAQSWKWDTFPLFGSLVMTQQHNRTILGIVYEVTTGSMDPVRHPFPYQKTEEELLIEQPQIFEFLQTTFSCVVVGYQEKGHIFYLRSPQPPKIHSFVNYPDPDLSKQFFHNTQYLHILFGATPLIGNLDELLLAILAQQKQKSAPHEDTLKRFIESYSLLAGNDYRRIKLFLQRVQSIFSQ